VARVARLYRVRTGRSGVDRGPMTSTRRCAPSSRKPKRLISQCCFATINARNSLASSFRAVPAVHA
jgi:hypothetical protein